MPQNVVANGIASRPVCLGRTAPGPRGLPLLGNLIGFARDPLGFTTNCKNRFGDVVAFRLGPAAAILLSDPNEVERVLVKEHQAFPKHHHFWRQVTAVFGNGLLTSSDALWRRQRRLAAPAFAGQALDGYADVMVRESEQTIASWRVGETRNLHADMMVLSLRITAKALFGTHLNDDVAVMEAALDDIIDEISSRIRRPILIPDAVPLPGHIRYRRGVRRIERIVARVIAERRASPDATDLLATLMRARDDDGSDMSDRQLRDEAITFVIGGHETTALALSWAIHLLGHHPEIDAELAAEVRNVLGGRSATIEDVPRLSFTAHVIAESMRLYPPAWGIGREASQDCEIGGYRVKAKTPIFILPWILHRDPRFFDDPLTFRPQRWQGDLAQRLPRFAYMPFGGGPRICIGSKFAMMEAVLLLATLIQRFRFVAQPDRPAVPHPSITLRPRGGVWVHLEARS